MTRRRGTAFDRTIDRLVAGVALAGGLLLLGAAATTVVSVIGRAVGLGPIAGDFEIVEMATGMAVFCALPWAQVQGAHVAVTAFTDAAPPILRAVLDRLAALATAAVIGIVAWRVTLGGWDLAGTADSTMVLGLPRWWLFVPAIPAAILFAVVALRDAVRGPVPDDREAEGAAPGGSAA